MLRTLFIVVVLAMGSLLVVPGYTADGNERPYGARAYEGKMIDSHSHPRKTSLEELTGHFTDVSEAGIERVIIMRTPNDYRNSKRDVLLSRAPQFPVVRTLCSADFVGYIHQDQIELAREEVVRIKANLGIGRCAGVGEVGLRHYDKRWQRGGGQHEIVVSLDHPLVHEVLGAANQHAAPVVLHIEPVYRPRAINDLAAVKEWYKKICTKYPQVRLIAAHTGMMGPQDLEELLLSCPNLFADFKVLHSNGSVVGFEDLHGVNDLDFRFFEDWAAMFEKYPVRFIFGSDWKEGRRRGYRGRSYVDHIRRVRKMLGSLSPAVQKSVAYSNAKRIFGRP